MAKMDRHTPLRPLLRKGANHGDLAESDLPFGSWGQALHLLLVTWPESAIVVKITAAGATVATATVY